MLQQVPLAAALSDLLHLDQTVHVPRRRPHLLPPRYPRALPDPCLVVALLVEPLLRHPDQRKRRLGTGFVLLGGGGHLLRLGVEAGWLFGEIGQGCRGIELRECVVALGDARVVPVEEDAVVERAHQLVAEELVEAAPVDHVPAPEALEFPSDMAWTSLLVSLLAEVAPRLVLADVEPHDGQLGARGLLGHGEALVVELRLVAHLLGPRDRRPLLVHSLLRQEVLVLQVRVRLTITITPRLTMQHFWHSLVAAQCTHWYTSPTIGFMWHPLHTPLCTLNFSVCSFSSLRSSFTAFDPQSALQIGHVISAFPQFCLYSTQIRMHRMWKLFPHCFLQKVSGSVSLISSQQIGHTVSSYNLCLSIQGVCFCSITTTCFSTFCFAWNLYAIRSVISESVYPFCQMMGWFWSTLNFLSMACRVCTQCTDVRLAEHEHWMVSPMRILNLWPCSVAEVNEVQVGMSCFNCLRVHSRG